LHETDFIQLADCLFKPFPTKEVDFLYKQLEQAKRNSDLHLDNLREFIPKSNWARYFSSLVDCEDTFLRKRWTELYDLRCLVAHNNLMRKSDFDRIVTLISEIKPKLEKAIGNLDKVKVPEQEKENLAENIVANLSNPKIKFTSYFLRIIEYLWNKGHLREVTTSDLLTNLGAGAYGNYNKLRLKPWSLIEDSDKSNDKRAIRLTEKGKNFAQGLLKIPEEISKSTASDEWEASPVCREILITDVNN